MPDKSLPETRLLFETRGDIRDWLTENGRTSGGVWLIFGKESGPKTLTYEEALEEALCFGWVDGQMKSIDSATYLRYLAPRRKGSAWSEKNKALVKSLEERGLMTEAGREKVLEAQKSGKWDVPPPVKITDEEIGVLKEALLGYEPAYANFLNMPPSVQRTYTAAYFAPKSEKTRSTRLEWIIDRLDKNLKPM